MSTRTIDRLIFVFNADSGLLSALLDSAKKVLQIKGCTLCAITHGLAGEKSDWSECKAELGVQVDYLHRDELKPDLRRLVGDGLPCVVAQADGEQVLPSSTAATAASPTSRDASPTTPRCTAWPCRSAPAAVLILHVVPAGPRPRPVARPAPPEARGVQQLL